MDKAAARVAAQLLLQRCIDSGVNFPRTKTSAQNAVECGAVLLANRQGDAFDEDAAFEQLRSKYGVVQNAASKAQEQKQSEDTAAEAKASTPKKKRKKSDDAESKSQAKEEEGDVSATDDEVSADKKPGKKRKAASPKPKISEQATVPENKDLAIAFHQLSRESFRVGDRMPGMAYAKVAKIIREFPEQISSSDQLKGIKGVGKASLAKTQEFLDNGFISKLEELRSTA